MTVASFYIRSCVCVFFLFVFFQQLPVENSGENYFHLLELLTFFNVMCFEKGSFYTRNGNFGDLQIFTMNGNLSSFQKILIFVYFLQLFFCPFFNLRVIPETEERLSRFEEYYWLAKDQETLRTTPGVRKQSILYQTNMAQRYHATITYKTINSVLLETNILIMLVLTLNSMDEGKRLKCLQHKARRYFKPRTSLRCVYRGVIARLVGHDCIGFYFRLSTIRSRLYCR